MSTHHITYLELLQLIKAHKAPKTITFEGNEYKFTGMSYKSSNKGFLGTCAALLYSEVTLASRPLILYRDEILDDAEREYLRSVIKPFRKQVISIVKSATVSTSKATGNPTEYIRVYYNEIETNVRARDDLTFPLFEGGSMYTGMEPFKHYTPEDLGL